jgi:hypothetical protein
MIVTSTAEGWRCVTQPDHARVSHDILALWRADGLPHHPRRDELLMAVREHDNGWREADAAPRRDPSGQRPRDFMEQSEGARFEIWRRGIDRFRQSRPYVAALILEHALFLHRDRRGTPAWDAFLGTLAAERRELAAAGLDLAQLEADYRWLHLADLVSLAACAGWEESFERWGLRGRLQGDTLTLAPFPLAGATRFRVACRLLPRGEHASDAALATTLASCRWRDWTLRNAP